MVDKLFLRGELFVLRCSFKNLPILCPTLIGSFFHEVFYTKDGLDFSLAHGYRSVRPTHPGPSGLVFCFYPLHIYIYIYGREDMKRTPSLKIKFKRYVL